MRLGRFARLPLDPDRSRVFAVEQIKEGTLKTECGKIVGLKATFPNLASGTGQNGVRAKFRIEGREDLYILATKRGIEQPVLNVLRAGEASNWKNWESAKKKYRE